MLFSIQLKLLLLLIVGLTARAENICRIPIGSIHYNRYQWPLVYKLTGELYPTTLDAEQVRHVEVAADAEALLSCGPNYLKQYAYKRLKTLKVQCQGESGNFSVAADQTGVSDAGKVKGIEEYACDLRVMEEVLAPVAGCSNPTWTAVAFGYEQPFEDRTYILGEACYDSGKGQTRLVHIKMGKNDDASYVRKMPATYLARQRHPDGRYKVELFRGLFFDEIYQRIREKLHVSHAPGLHLAHYLDETLLSNAQFRSVQKLGWNYYVSHDNLEAWQGLKEDVRRLAESHKLDVFVGSHGVQQLQGPQGEKMELYLQPAAGEKGRFPMPQLLWLVVHQEGAKEMFAFGVFNEAANEINAPRQGEQPICRSQCEKVEWLSAGLKAGGKLICCTYDEFRQVVTEMI